MFAVVLAALMAELAVQAAWLLASGAPLWRTLFDVALGLLLALPLSTALSLVQEVSSLRGILSLRGPLRGIPGTGPRRERIPWPGAWLLRCAAGLCAAVVIALAAVAVGVRAAIGQPLSWSMWGYAKDIHIAQLWGRTDVVAALVLWLLLTATCAALLAVAQRRFSSQLQRRAVRLNTPQRAVAVMLAIVSLISAARYSSLSPAPALLALWQQQQQSTTNTARSDWQAPLLPAWAGDDDDDEPLVYRHTPPQHVVLWLLESTGARHVNLPGHNDVMPRTTPNLHALARAHGVAFLSHVAPAPLSIKALFSTLCGLYPLPTAAFESRALPNMPCDSLMQSLQQAHAPTPVRMGLFHGGYFAFTDKRALLEHRGFEILRDGENLPGRATAWHNGWGVDDAIIVDEALRWLSDVNTRSPNTPTFTVMVPLIPHHEYFLPPHATRPFGERTLAQRHQNAVHYADEQLGRFVDGLKRSGQWSNTLLVVVGDHGEAFLEHPHNQLHGSELFEENVHAPLVFISEGLFDGLQTRTTLSAHPDIVASVMGLVDDARVPLLRTQGRNLFSRLPAPARAIPLVTMATGTRMGMRTARYKYVSDGKVAQLFDLATDPAERHNIAPVMPALTQHLAARTADFVATQPDILTAMLASKMPAPVPRVMDAMSVLVDDQLCPRTGEIFRCAQDAVVEAVVDRAFNMEQMCLRVTFGSAKKIALHIDDQRIGTVGVALTDRSRFAHGTPVSATFARADLGEAVLEVNDAFDRCSAHKSVNASTQPLTVTLATANPQQRAVCLTLGE